MAGEDFVQVKMSAAGEIVAGDGAVIRVQTPRSHHEFHAGKALRVVKSYEWPHLSRQVDAAGDPLFELVPAATSQAQDETTIHIQSEQEEEQQ